MKNYFLFIVLLTGNVLAQKQIHIQYLNVRSAIANVHEDLYTDGTNVISKQDGNIIYTNPEYNTKKKGKDYFFISNIDSNTKVFKDFLFTESIGYSSENNYFVHDKVPKIDWVIDENSTRTILGYNCTKATAKFRGSDITAYFTKKIPYPIGPFKFYGLPGAILDVRVDRQDYDLWKAIKVETDYKAKVDYQPQFPDLEKLQMKRLIELKDKDRERFSSKVSVPGSTGKSAAKRFGVEKIFEWENEPEK
ncbi:MAG: GLPGLI family protein [Chryseobacterium sp.]|uniref:GLPGLI family protein n=1 Tax=Chryseobacterium sp. TaxID=1871047 RepID=UPI0025BB160A|nr:GLPGLI family protein [Chryseobacterium sp.]MCJ7934780.1 GLPGLI family protein [Chryseobacterium sp.]